MRRGVLIAVAGVAALAVGVPVAVWAVSSSGDAADFRGSEPPVRRELPAFSLRDHAGRTLSGGELRGKAVLVTFLDTKCRQACPIVAELLRTGLDRLTPEERGATTAVAFSVHPGDDTPAAVRAFLRRHRVENAIRYLVGTEAELRPVWDAFQVLPAVDSGSSDVHSAPVRVYAPDGVWVSTLNVGADLTPENLAHDVRLALETGG